MIWQILAAVAIVLVVVMFVCVLLLLRAAAKFERDYPHLTDYKSEWEEIKEEKSDVKKV